jgi:Ulp1 family protease
MKMKVIRYYDSLCCNKDGDKYTITMLRYLNDMSQLYRCEGLDLKEWKFIRCTINNTPQQSNIYDCGVFTALFAYLLTYDISLQPLVKIPKLDTTILRQHMYNAIALGSLNY